MNLEQYISMNKYKATIKAGTYIFTAFIESDCEDSIRNYFKIHRSAQQIVNIEMLPSDYECPDCFQINHCEQPRRVTWQEVVKLGREHRRLMQEKGFNDWF